jgi:hypothetical protein
MTISESLLEKCKARVERGSHPVEIIATATKRHADRERDASIRSAARYDNDAEKRRSQVLHVEHTYGVRLFQCADCTGTSLFRVPCAVH